MIKKTDSFKEYKKLLDEPLLHETVQEAVPIGRVARFEFDFKNDEDEIVKVNSYLTYVIDYEKGTLEEYIVDYSELYTSKRIALHNLIEETVEYHDVSQVEGFQEYISEIENNLEQELNEAKEEEALQASDGSGAAIQAAGTVCWQCSKYETSKSNRSSWCDYFFSVGCGAIGMKTTIAGWLLCSGVQGVACWIPSYRICVQGKWTSICPM
ncbi:hypothetical protein CU633_16230 [Bacillus sp. V3-13]|uniref:hypothetical protein n=1 Tax=Bacillus sp. V3-13 TaxID=2053728 RepID=UPI000C77C352|nr:hypothetical protein [Bacillus sp. V3-13]PLR76247.1 hypothetical protein CU633_16230 [Bacillus sp. V3-13]